MITCVENGCKRWGLILNLDKTKVAHFRNPKKKQTNFKFVYNNKEISVVGSYKYLGIIIIAEHLNFSECIQALSESGGRALGYLVHVTLTYVKGF